jgi:PGF-pre-PGF domain-containing protein
MDESGTNSSVRSHDAVSNHYPGFNHALNRYDRFLKGTLLLTGIIVFFVLVPPVAALDWTTETVDSTGDVGYYPSLALDVSGQPRISYWDWTNIRLKYAAKTGGVWINETVDETKNSGEFSSLELDASGRPSISYYDSNVGNLSFVTTIEDDWTRITVDSGGVGRYTSLALDSAGNPGIAYQDLLNLKLKYAARNGGLWTNETVDNSGNVGAYASLARDGAGNPSISYYDAGHGFLTYAAKSGGLWSCSTVDTTGNVGYYTSLALDSAGNPRISYYDGTGRNLKFASRTGGVWMKEIVDSAGSVGKYSSLALDTSGNPHISYFDETNGHLKYAVKNGLVWTNETVDTGPNVGSYSSIALDNAGDPRISYRDAGNGNLKYATGILPLVPNFSAFPQNGTVPLNVQFSDTSTGGSPSCWNWSFGDGSWFNTTLAAERNPAHVYEIPGVYDVTMIVRNFTVAVSLSRSDFITITAPPATTEPTSSPTSFPTTPDPTPTLTPTSEPTPTFTPIPSTSPAPEPTSSLTPAPSASPTPEPVSSVTPAPSSSPAPESPFSPIPSPSPVALPDSGSDDPPDMPPVHREPGPLVCQTVKVGGDTAVSRVTVTGRDISDIIITARRVAILPVKVTPPALPVYQYVDLTPVHYATISRALIEFDVPITFSDRNHAISDQVRLCMLRNLSWVCLPTRASGNINGQAHYRAESPEFSLFAIALSNETSGIHEDALEVQTVKDALSLDTPVNPRVPVVTQTSPAAAAAEPERGNPLVPEIIGITGLCGAAIGMLIIFRTGNRR